MVIVITQLHTTFMVLLAIVPFFMIPVFADVEVEGVSGFYGHDEAYNVIGVVKNSGNYSALAAVTIQLEYGNTVVETTVYTHNIKANGEIPFKIPLYDTDGEIPKIFNVRTTHINGISHSPQIEVLYDETLVVHPEGHVTGRIVNSGDTPVKHVKLVAVAHDENHAPLDVVSNEIPITYMMPGEMRNFTMYPDTAVAKNVQYYSCFGLGDLSVISLNVQRSGETFPVRYDSGLLLAYPEFNNENTDLSINIAGGWPLHESINIEFPKYNDEEKFNLSIDDKPIEFIQSVDEFGSWHVAFNVEPQFIGTLVISGFDPDAVYDIIPQRIREGAKMWAFGEINSTEFSTSVAYLVGKHNEVLLAPDWVRSSAGWWAAGLVTDEEFVASLKYLDFSGILRTS